MTAEHDTTNDIKGWQCLLDTTRTAEGYLIEGHMYSAALKITDESTSRSYEVLACERCGHMDVSYNGAVSHTNDDVFRQSITIRDE